MTHRPHWDNIEAFYRDRGGERSLEYDFGVGHHADTDTAQPAHLRTRWRVSVVRATGDVYAITAQAKHVVLLGTFAHQVGDEAFRDRMDEAFAGWADNLGGRPLGWFEDRIPGAAPEVEHTPGTSAGRR